jgi:hypothetical protein
MLKRTLYLAVALTLLLSACKAKEANISVLSVPTAALSALVSTPVAITDAHDPHCPLNPAQADAIAPLLPRSYADKNCLIEFSPGGSITGVRLVYPDGWTVSLINPEGTSLLFELVGKQIFFQAYPSSLPLDQADTATYSFDQVTSEPVVGADEVVKDRIFQDIGSKQVLVLTTTLSDQTIRRYFIAHAGAGGAGGTIYTFQVTVLSPSSDNTFLLPLIESMINLMEFKQ